MLGDHTTRAGTGLAKRVFWKNEEQDETNI